MNSEIIRHVEQAIKSTNGLMLWDVIVPDREALEGLIATELNYCDGDKDSATRRVIVGILDSHCEKMVTAMQFETREAKKAALLYPQNVD